MIEATVRDSVSCSDVSDEASSSSASGDLEDHNDDDDSEGNEDRQNGAVHLPSTPTDVRDISLDKTDERPSNGLDLLL